MCRIPCLSLCLADVERVCRCRAPNSPCGVHGRMASVIASLFSRSRPPPPAGLHATTPSVGQTSGATQRCLNLGFSERIGIRDAHEPSQKTTAPRDGTRVGRRRRVWQTRSLETRHKRVCTGYVACNRAVSLSARLKTSGAPDRRDLPVCEGHVQRCVPWKQVRTRGVAACHPGRRQGRLGDTWHLDEQRGRVPEGAVRGRDGNRHRQDAHGSGVRETPVRGRRRHSCLVPRRSHRTSGG